MKRSRLSRKTERPKFNLRRALSHGTMIGGAGLTATGFALAPIAPYVGAPIAIIGGIPFLLGATAAPREKSKKIKKLSKKHTKKQEEHLIADLL